MSTHELKTDPTVFQSVLDGEKTYEIRKNDRGFAVGDSLLLRETLHTGRNMAMGSPLVYTGRQIERRVSHMLVGPIYGLADGWCVLSLNPASKPSEPAQDEALKMARSNIESLQPRFHANYSSREREFYVAGFDDGRDAALAQIDALEKP